MPRGIAYPEHDFRRELMQCQYCFKSKTDGITLSKCSGCKRDVYCSKECQRSAWPEHKSRCRMISQAKDRNDEQLVQNKKLLSTFMTKHQPTLCESAIRALDLGNKPENAERYFLAVHLSRRPGKHPPQSAFEVIRAEQTPYEIMGPEKAKIMMNERAQIDQNNRRTGMDGTFFVVLYDSVSLARSALPVGYSKETTFKEPGPWKEMLFECMNEGVVF